jgi:hypothetical protein
LERLGSFYWDERREREPVNLGQFLPAEHKRRARPPTRWGGGAHAGWWEARGVQGGRGPWSGCRWRRWAGGLAGWLHFGKRLEVSACFGAGPLACPP